ncbi:MAG: NAD kinase [Bacteroidia bacterium]|jgi:NAD+ kinase|nr:NAD kinase [Bacteroidia bacterium]
MRIAVFGRNIKPVFYESLKRLFEILSQRKVEVVIYRPFLAYMERELDFKPVHMSDFSSHKDLKNIDFFFSIGGDGAFLEAISLVRDSGIPMVGINSGRLGFLADVAQAELESALERFFAGQYYLQPRSLIKLENDLGLFADFPYALNEFTVHKQDTSQMITVHVEVGGDYLNSYWADGLIISTPTGSTAYSLSVGGPIITPTAANFIIAPIAPHNLAIRPVVVPDSEEIKLMIEGRGERYLASLDSRSDAFGSDIVMRLKKADFSINVLQFDNQSFYSTLRNKLMWGIDKRN